MKRKEKIEFVILNRFYLALLIFKIININYFIICYSLIYLLTYILILPILLIQVEEIKQKREKRM